MFRKTPQYVSNQYVAPPPRQEPSSDASLNASIHNADVRTGNLDARIQQLEQQIVNFRQEMRRNRPGTSGHNAAKRRALQAMRQKKALESRVEAASNAAFNLEQIRDAKGMQQDNVDYVQGLRVANKELRVAQHSVDLDEVEDLRDDMQEALEDVSEVSNVLGRSYEVDNVDNAELEAELDEFEQDAIDYAGASHVETPSYLRPQFHQATQRPGEARPAQQTTQQHQHPGQSQQYGGPMAYRH